MTPCRFVDRYQRLGGGRLFPPYLGSTDVSLKSIYQTTQRHGTESNNVKITALITSNVTKHKPFYDFPSIMKGRYSDIPRVRYVSLSGSWMHSGVVTAIGRSGAVVNRRLILVMWFCLVRMSVVSTRLFGR